MSEHYSDGRRYSAISKTWILLSSWNDREEIASLTEQLQVQREELARMTALDEASRSTQTAEYVNGLLQHRGQLTSALAVLEQDHARLEGVCNHILAIMKTYHEQEQRASGVGTPGGLEHMGDVWKLFHKWEAALADRRST